MPTADEQLRFWKISRDTNLADDLQKLVMLCAERELDERGTLQFLSAERIEALQRELLEKLPGDFESQPGEALSFTAP